MPPDKGSSGHSGIITIAVAVIGAVALIVAAYIQNQPETHNDPPAHVTPSSNEPKVPPTQSPVVTPPPQEGETRLVIASITGCFPDGNKPLLPVLFLPDSTLAL
jgi:hypothetical protein